MNDYCLLLVTWPDEQSVKPLIESWLENSLAACVNLLPMMQSYYRWEGKLQHGREHQLIIKTTKARYQELQQSILAQHPYSCPEILCIDIKDGHHAYLHWIGEMTA